MKKGQILIAQELLLDWLRFQQGHILGVTWDYDQQVLRIAIEHPDMPETEEGQPYPIVTPAYRRIELLGYQYERLPGALTSK